MFSSKLSEETKQALDQLVHPSNKNWFDAEAAELVELDIQGRSTETFANQQPRFFHKPEKNIFSSEKTPATTSNLVSSAKPV